MRPPLIPLAILTSAAMPLTLVAATQAPMFPGGIRTPIYSAERRERIPPWMELPRTARLSIGDGLRFRPLHNSAVSFENLKIGVLVGAMRNDGDCATSLNARLHYVDAQWQPLGDGIPNEARVSQVEPGGLLPYRFRLRNVDDSTRAPAAYVIVVEQDHNPLANPFSWDRWVSTRPDTTPPRACEPTATRVTAQVSSRTRMRDGYLVGGTITLVEGDAVRADGVVITALLRDKQDQVLEVLVGTPSQRDRALRDGLLLPDTPVPFRLRTDIPVGDEVDDVTVMVELLPDAVVSQ